MKKGVIAGFQGDYRWLSTFERCDLLYKGVLYKSAEAAFQAQKTTNSKVRFIFSRLDARDAMELGKEIKVRDNWVDIRLQVMEDISSVKFNLHKFKLKLVDTGEMELINTIHWDNQFWGIYNGWGENNLGRVIMAVRNEIKNQLKYAGK